MSEEKLNNKTFAFKITIQVAVIALLLSCGSSSSTTSSSTDADGDGFLASTNDCDDNDASVNPDATEVCDNVDNDCDGETDENDASDVTIWYFDGDEDTFGDPNTTTTACDQPTNFVSDNTDCDDDTASTNPNGTETFNNVDDDCDDLVDEEVSVAQATTTWNGSSAGGQLGYAVSNAGDFDNDGNDDVLLGAPFEDANGTDSGKVYIFYGDITSGEVALSSANANIPGENAGDEFGYALDGSGDFENDGVEDIMVGAPGESTDADDAGAGYLIYGETTQFSGSLDLNSCTSGDADCRKVRSSTANDKTGTSVSIVSDLNDDGRDELFVAAPFNDNSVTDAGLIWFRFGQSTRDTGAVGNLGNASGRFEGETSQDTSGAIICDAGDTNGDGDSQFLVGSPGEDTNGSNAGATYVTSSASGTRSLSISDAKLTGESADDAAGTSVGGNGDLNGDGFSDVLVGAPGDDTGGTNAGAVYVIYGSASGISDMSLSAADVKFYSGSGGDQLGGSKDAIDFAGDVNGDGYDDILVAASSANSNTGAVWLIYGSATTYSGDIDLADLNTSGNPTGVKFVGISEDDLLGFSVSRAGDVDGDGKDDILFGAPGRDSSKGAAYLFKSPF